MLARVLTVLDAFDGDATLPVADLGRRVGLPRATVHRMVNELVDLGLLERAGKDVALGVRLFELGSRVPTQRRLREVGGPYLQDLYTATRLPVVLGVPDGNDALCIVRVNGHHDAAATMAEGDRLPLHATALGKALLAFSPPALVVRIAEAGLRPLTPYTIAVPQVLLDDLARTRQSGIAFDREEAKLGDASVACPILGPGGDAVAALSVTASVHHFQPTRLAHAVRDAAVGIARDLPATRRLALLPDAQAPSRREITSPVAS